MQKIKKYTIKNIILSLGVKQLDRAGILELLNTCGHDLVKKATMKDVTKATKFAIFCHNCHTTMKKKKKIPRMSISNGLELDDIPYELKIPTDIEQQLFATCLIFMKFINLPKTRMKGQKDGKMINVPIQPSDVTNTFKSLPRCADDAALVPLQLKRKKEYKNSHFDGLIRPNVCINAVKKLKELHNPYYKDVIVNYFPMTSPPAKRPKLDEDNSNDEEVTTESDEEEVEILNNVKEFQADHVENTCLIREDLEARIVENRTTKVMHKQKGNKTPISVQPGEGKVMICHFLGNNTVVFNSIVYSSLDC